ncbi:MAG: hypothetical protein ACRYE9_00405 [Janthinobacterium lividum]
MRKQLEHSYTKGKLYNSWLIHTNNIEETLKELKIFIISKLLGEDIPLENHTDFKFITKLKEDNKNIVIEQIRGLQDFLSKTSGITQYRVAIIYEADLMNMNAANSCLKLLEDTPNNSYIFLLTKNPTHILPTIKSRCKFLVTNLLSEKSNTEINNKFTQLLLNTNSVTRLDFINKISEKNRKSWLDFSDMVINIIAKFVKKSLGIHILLSEIERQLINQIKLRTTRIFLAKYEQVNQIITDVNEYDLDMRVGFVLIIEQFRR